MNNVNKTLYIPLYGKAYVSRRGLFLQDPKAEEIWAAEGFPLKGKSASKWLAFYMGIRAAVFDCWVKEKLEEAGGEETAVIHLGCGMDSRALRTGTEGCQWYDVDFPAVIEERKRYFDESASCHMVSADVRDGRWLAAIPECRRAVVVMEGITMYLKPEELQVLIIRLCGHFREVHLLMDCYTEIAAKMSKHKNPINDVGVTEVYGMDRPETLETEDFVLVSERDMTPESYIRELQGMEETIFRRLYAGNVSKKLYRLYEYRKGGNAI